MNIEKDELLLKKRILELARVAEIRQLTTFTDFFSMNDLHLYYSLRKELPRIESTTYGGYPSAERKIIFFHSENVIPNFQERIHCIQITPKNKKFSDDLTHRDFLGAVLNLGIERSKIGDILVDEKEGFLFSCSSISTFIIESLIKVKHTNVNCYFCELDSVDIQPRYKEITGTVPSERLDAMIALAFSSSRTSILSLISGGKVFVNSRIVETNSYLLKENDIISVRGQGKFIYKGLQNQTKKGRYLIKLHKYI